MNGWMVFAFVDNNNLKKKKKKKKKKKNDGIVRKTQKEIMWT